METAQKTSSQFMSMLHSYGLSLDAQTGGHIPCSLDDFTISRAGSDYFELSREDEDPILFLGWDVFMKTVRVTEESLKLQLFV